MAAGQRVPLLYIGGIGRSGSTLVEQFLSDATGYATVGEMVHLWQRGVRDDELCTCQRHFSACPFWSAVGERAFGGWAHVDVDAALQLQAAVDRTRHLPQLAGPLRTRGFGEARSAYTSLLTKLYEAVTELSGAPGIIDASKHASTAHLLADVPGIDLAVVHVVRDSPAVAHSWTRKVRRPQVTDRDDYMACYSPMRSAVQWNVQNGLVDALRWRGVEVVRVRYEDVVADPGHELRRLLRRLGRDPGVTEAGLTGLAGAAAPEEHAISGNPSRWDPDARTVRRDDEWREALSARDRRSVMWATAPLRWRYGYVQGPAAGAAARPGGRWEP